MKRIYAIFLFCIFFSYDNVLLAAKNTRDIKDELDKIFFKGLEIDQIVDNTISDLSLVNTITSDEFFKDWHTLEYFEFLSLLNELFKQKDSIPRNFIQRKIFSKLLEIFGGIYTQQFIQQNDNDWYFPEGVLDSVDFLLTQSPDNLKRHDGAILTIDKKSIAVRKILEVKPFFKSYSPDQSKSVLYRWLTKGINAANMFFPFTNITNRQELQLYLDELNKNKNIKNINYDHDELILIYTLSVFDILHFKKHNFSVRNILRPLSEIICDKLFESNFNTVLDSMNNQFINLIINLYNAYMELTKELIPSIYGPVVNSSTQNPEKKYCIEHRKNFIVTFISIGRNDILWNYVLTTMKKIFSRPEKLDSIRNAMSSNKYAVSEPADIKQQIKEKLIELLGENNKDIISHIVSNAQYYVSTRDPAKDLQHKYNVLLDYFKEKQEEDKQSNSSKKSSLLSPEEIVQTIILSNLESFLSITPLEYKINLLQKFNLSIEESYEIFIKYLDKLYYIGVIEEDYVAFIKRNIYPQRWGNASNFEVLSFIWEHNFECILEKHFRSFYESIWDLIDKLESNLENATDNDSREQKIYNLFHQYFTEHPLLSKSVKDVVRRIILAHSHNIMKNLVIVRLESFLEQLSKLNLSGEESYEIMIRYIDFDSKNLNNLDISQEKIDIVRETIPTLETNFKALCFIFSNKIECISSDATIKMLCLYIDNFSIDKIENNNIKQNFSYLTEYFSKYLKKGSPSLTSKVQEILAERPLIFINTSSNLVKIFLNVLSGLKLSLKESVTIITRYFDLDILNTADITRERIDFIRDQDPKLRLKRDFDILVYIYENKLNTLKTTSEYWIPLALILSKYFQEHPINNPSIQIRTIIGSHLSNFMYITPEELNNFLKQLDTLNISGEEAYILMTQHFGFNSNIMNRLDISKEKIDAIKKNYPSTREYNDFTILCFIFNHMYLALINPSQIEKLVHNSDNLLSYFQNGHFIQSDNSINLKSILVKCPNKDCCINYFSKLSPPDDSTSQNNIQ